MKHFIYADNAATTKIDEDALKAMLPWLQDEYGNASQPYSFARNVRKAIAEAREATAQCIGCLPEEIYFTSSGTESDNWAVKGLLERGDTRKTVTSQIEHHAILNACAAIERLGFPVEYLPVDRQGVLMPETLRNAMTTHHTKLVSVMMANNETGVIEPISDLAAIAHEHNALFHTDAVQAVGHIPVDVRSMGVDMLSASGHKFNGPKGIGFLYIRKGTKIYPFMDGGAQESGLRAGTENIAGIVGMAAALKKNCAELTRTALRLQNMKRAFLDVLKCESIDFILNGSDKSLPGHINISIKDASGEMLLHRLDLKGICISTGSACDSVNTRLSHVIKATSVPAEYAEGTIRISFGRDNKESEAVETACAIVDILKK